VEGSLPAASTPAASVKEIVQRGIQRLHHAFLDKGLPRQVALYFHTLAERDRPAFAAAVRWFVAQGYRLAACPLDFLRDDPQPVLWVSFDDNFHDWAEARPLFDELGVRATFYVNTGVFRDRVPAETLRRFIRSIEGTGAERTLTTDELRALRADGHVIGAHTHTHPVLSRIAPARARAEILRSKVELETILGEPVQHFAYPYGLRRYFDDQLISYCKSIGFETVARAIPALQHAPQDPWEIHRHGWRFNRSLDENINDLRVDGQFFERLTGRSAVG
jgi:peptidoglycan/xylan/chitin deacetylase (PgdA/CDA1 family)